MVRRRLPAASFHRAVPFLQSCSNPFPGTASLPSSQTIQQRVDPVPSFIPPYADRRTRYSYTKTRTLTIWAFGKYVALFIRGNTASNLRKLSLMNLGSSYACFEANGIRAASNDKLTMVTGRRLLRTPYPTQLSSLNCSVFSVHLFTGLGRRGGPLFACKGHGRATQLCQRQHERH